MNLKRVIKKNRKILLSVMAIAFPAIADLFAQTLLGFFDMIMVGKLGTEAISAVGIGNIPAQTIIPVFYAISTGTTALVSRAYGGNNREEGKKAIAQSLILALPLSLVITVLLFIFQDETLKMVSRAKDIDLNMVKGYYSSILMGIPFLCFNVIFFAGFRSINKANIPMKANIMSIVSNVVFNYLFIFTLKMGVTGAGIATTISRGLATIYFIYLTFYTDKYWISIKFQELKKFNRNIASRILKVGFPAAFEQGLLRVGMLIFEVMVISLGGVAYTAHKIALTAESFSYNMGFGFAVAGTALVGQQLGKNSVLNAKRDAIATTVLSTIVMSIFGFFFFLIPQIIIGMFTQDLEVKKMAVVALRLVSICQPFQAVSMVLSGCLRGAGDTKAVLIITIIGIYLIRIPLTYLFLNFFNIGLSGAWIVMTIDLGFRSIVCYKVFKKGRWSYVKV